MDSSVQLNSLEEDGKLSSKVLRARKLWLYVLLCLKVNSTMMPSWLATDQRSLAAQVLSSSF